jgi:GT2 family glycosyltransferase
VIVLDNASTDDTEMVVRSLADSRVTFIRNETNVGPLVNWNRAIELNSSQYLNILPDDDLMLPGFIRESVTVLDRHRKAAFSFTAARYVDVNRVPLESEFNHTRDVPEGVIDGLRFLDLNVRSHQSKCLIEPSSAMIRATALAEVGKFDALYIQSHFDLNLYLRLARRFE